MFIIERRENEINIYINGLKRYMFVNQFLYNNKSA